jgi:MFS family permease
MAGIRSIPKDIVILSVSFALIFMGTGASQQFLVPLFAKTTAWSPIARGAIPASVYLSMMLWRVPAVWIVSRIGERSAMLLGGATYVGFPIVIYFASSFYVLILAGVTWGVGATLMWVTSSTRVLDAVSERSYGKASGLFIGSVFSGILVGVLLLSRIADIWSLRTVFIVASGISAVGWLVMMTLPAKHTTRERPNIATLRTITRMPNWRIVGVLLGLSAMGYGLMLGPLSECIVRELGVSSLALTAAHPAARLVVSFIGGWLSDVIGRRRMIVAGFLIGGVGLACTSLATASPIALGVGILAIGLLGGIAPTMGMAFVGDVAGTDTRLMVHSSLFVHNDLGVAGAILTGQLLQTQAGGFSTTFGVFSVILLASGIWALMSFRPAAAKL